MTALPIEVFHAPSPRPAAAQITVVGAEHLLADWFGAEVVLTSSGRSAMLLYFATQGLSRYRDRIALPRLMSACVLDAVIRHGFPIDVTEVAAAPASLSILYHQYGIPQLDRPTGPVLEDICHAFFAAPETGERAWAGAAAVFSLPKFFSTASMAGGLVTRSAELARRLRDARDTTPLPAPADQARMAAVFQSAYSFGGDALEHVYLERLLHPRIADTELGGVPATLAEIRSIGYAREAILNRLLTILPRESLPDGWRDAVAPALPFAWPLFGAPTTLERWNAGLAAAGIAAGTYQIDCARTMSRPSLAKAVLLPCHHLLTSTQLDCIARLLRA